MGKEKRGSSIEKRGSMTEEEKKGFWSKLGLKRKSKLDPNELAIMEQMQEGTGAETRVPVAAPTATANIQVKAPDTPDMKPAASATPSAADNIFKPEAAVTKTPVNTASKANNPSSSPPPDTASKSPVPLSAPPSGSPKQLATAAVLADGSRLAGQQVVEKVEPSKAADAVPAFEMKTQEETPSVKPPEVKRTERRTSENREVKPADFPSSLRGPTATPPRVSRGASESGEAASDDISGKSFAAPTKSSSMRTMKPLTEDAEVLASTGKPQAPSSSHTPSRRATADRKDEVKDEKQEQQKVDPQIKLEEKKEESKEEAPIEPPSVVKASEAMYSISSKASVDLQNSMVSTEQVRQPASAHKNILEKVGSIANELPVGKAAIQTNKPQTATPKPPINTQKPEQAAIKPEKEKKATTTATSMGSTFLPVGQDTIARATSAKPRALMTQGTAEIESQELDKYPDVKRVRTDLEVARLQRLVFQLESDLKAEREAKDALSVPMDKLKTRIRTLKMNLESQQKHHDTKLTEFSAELDNAKAAAETVKSENAKLSAELKALKSEFNKKLAEETSSLQQVVQDGSSKEKALANDLAESKKATKIAESALKDARARVAELEQQLKEARGDCDDNKQRSQELNTTLKKKDEELQAIEKLLGEARTRQQALVSDLDAAKAEADDAKQQLESTKQLADEQALRIQKLESQAKLLSATAAGKEVATEEGSGM